jgi:D-glycero-D-manno-heptose 1,7-bisphosphate phosphatase
MEANKRGILLLDRDGVINREQGYVWQWANWQWEEGIFDIATLATKRGYPMVVITNQGGIAKGLYHAVDVEALHAEMKAGFADNGTPIVDVFYCPHHPEHQICLCRKPNTLLFQRALAQQGADAARSFMIGDQPRDMLPAKRLGIKALYVGHKPEAMYDHRFDSVKAVYQWLEEHLPDQSR